MISASSPVPVFMKYSFCFPSGKVVLIFDVEAELMPPPPWLDTVVLTGSSCKSCEMAESILTIFAGVKRVLRAAYSMSEDYIVTDELLQTEAVEAA